MNLLTRLDPGDGCWITVISVAAMIAVVAVGADLLARLLRKRGAVSRHEIYLAALGLILVSPGMVIAIQRSGLILVTLSNRPEAIRIPVMDRPIDDSAPPIDNTALTPISPNPVRILAEPIALAPSLPAPTSPPLSLSQIWRATRGSLVAIWLLGVVALSLRLIHGCVALIDLQRRIQPIDVTKLGSVLSDVREAIGAKCLPRIFEDETAGPLAAGLFRPVVVLPMGLFERLGPEGLRDVLVHECAHALRRDGLVGLLQRVVAIAFWPHLLVHRLNRQLSRSREDVCDDYALNLGDPCRYARTLLTMAEHQGARPRGTAVVGLFESRSSLEDRLKRILEPGRTHPMRPNRLLTVSASVLLATLAVAVAAIRPVALAQEVKSVAKPKAPVIREGSATVIEGIVVDEKGSPVAGAVVDANVGGASENYLPSVKTGPDGRFTLPPNRYGSISMIRARTGKGEQLGSAVYQDRPGIKTGSLRLVVKSTQPLSVRVVDASGKPVSSAMVQVDTMPPRLVESGESDANGIAHFQVPTDWVTTVVAFKDGLGADYFENYQSAPTSIFELKPPPAEVALRLDGARTIRIKAVDSAGHPLANIRFGFNSIRKPGKLGSTSPIGKPWVFTDATGMAYYRWFPKHGSANLSAGDLNGVYITPDRPTLSATPSEDVGLTVRFVRYAELSGQVINPDGSPAQGIMVSAGGGKSGSNPQRFRRTDATGSYKLSVPPDDSYAVAAIDPRYAVKPITGIVVREGDVRAGLDFRLGGGTRLHGRFALGADGKFGSRTLEEIYVSVHLLGAEVPTEFLFSPKRKVREQLNLTAKPNDQGHYEILLGPGEYEISTPDTFKRETIRVDGTGEIVRDFLQAPDSNMTDLAGTIVDATPGLAEKPMASATITTMISRPNGQNQPIRSVATQSDAAGRFALKHQEVEDVIYAKDEQGKLAGFLALTKGLKKIKLELKPASTVSGRIVDHEGKPFVETRPNLRIVDGPGERHWRITLGWGDLDKNGRYRFTGIVPGAQYEVSFYAFEGPNRGERFVTKTFTVNSAEPIDLGDFTLPAKPIATKP